jgi:GNAT superfamily N-acetyltransferase
MSERYIRAIEPAEAEVILPLLEQVQSVHAAARPDLFRAETDRSELAGFLREWLSREAVTALVAFADGSPVGYLIFEIEERETRPLHHANRRGYLHHVCVDAQARRAGIASGLIDDMKARMRALGVSRVATAYWTFNEPSAALMARAGFVPCKIMAETGL